MAEQGCAGSAQLVEEEEQLFFDPEELDEAKEEEQQQQPEQVYEIEEEGPVERVEDGNEVGDEEDDDPKVSITGKKPISVKRKKPISDKPTLTKPFAATESNEEEQLEDDNEVEDEEDDDPKVSITGKKPISVKRKKPISDKPTRTKPFAATESNEEEQLEDDEEKDEEEEEEEEEKGTSEMKRRKNKAKMTVIISQSSQTGATHSTKRQAEAAAEKDSERKMKKQKKGTAGCDDDEEGKMCTKETKNNSVGKRIWSPEDEILIMERMNEFKKKDINPFGDRSTFFESIEKSLHATDVSCSKLFDKMYKLKRKYVISLERAKSGADHPLISNSHEVELYGLMKEFWGSVGATSDGKGDSTVARGGRTRSSGTAVVSHLKKAAPSNYKNLSHESILKEALKMLEQVKSQAVEHTWEDRMRKLRVAEVKIYLARIQLLHEQTTVVLDALMAAGS